MKVSRLWLSKFFDQPLPPADKLADALTFHAFEIDGIEKAGDDDVLDVKVTPNRGHDALSHRGVAAELSAILNIPLAHDPFAQKPVLLPKTAAVSVSIENAGLCPRYIAGYIKGVNVGPSPQWLKERLEAVGQRSINNVVDATNFVMFNLGQPLHAFDAGRLSIKSGAYKLGVRRATVDEVMTALDGKNYTLEHQNLIITDEDLKKPIGIAGVKGGMPAAITEQTKDIIIESANFDGPAVRRSAALLKLRTDASARFEQGLSPELAAYGMQAAVELILKLAGGELVGFADEYQVPQEQKRVTLSLARARQLLGETVLENDILNAFERLGFVYHKEGDTVAVEVPFQRLDLLIEEDIIEEAARIIGYDKIPAQSLPDNKLKPELNSGFYWSEKIREDLLGKGYSEVYTSVFADKGERVVLNKVDGVRPYLRATLLDGLTEALQKNIPNRYLLGLSEIKLFEIGTVWRGGKEEIMVGTAAEKEEPKETPLSAFQKPFDQWSHYEEFSLSKAVRYRPFSKYPYIVRDVAVWVPAATQPESVLQAIQKEAGELCIKEDIFDIFQKEGKMSLAFRLIFQSFDRTLTEVEVNAIMDKIYAALKTNGFEIR